MPCVWLLHDKSQIHLDVAVIDMSVYAEWLQNGDIMEHPHHLVFKALLDTGSQVTMISTRVATELGLTQRGLTQVAGVDGVSDHPVYYFHVGIRGADSAGEAGHHVGALHVFPDPIEGGEVNLSGFDFDVLLGMDVISRGSLAVEGSGTFSFSF